MLTTIGFKRSSVPDIIAFWMYIFCQWRYTDFAFINVCSVEIHETDLPVSSSLRSNVLDWTGVLSFLRTVYFFSTIQELDSIGALSVYI